MWLVYRPGIDDRPRAPDWVSATEWQAVHPQKHNYCGRADNDRFHRNQRECDPNASAGNRYLRTVWIALRNLHQWETIQGTGLGGTRIHPGLRVPFSTIEAGTKL